MPTYSYACTVCDHSFDVRQSFTDEPLKDCPVCFDSSLRKVIHPVGISFKGSGFYKTDSRASSETNPAGKGTSSSTESSPSSSSSSSSSESTAGASTSESSSSSSSGSSESSPSPASTAGASSSGGSSTAS